MQDLNQQLARVLRQKERETGKCTLEEWEQERLLLKEELENSKVKVRGYAVSVKPRELLGTHRCYGISTPVPSCACSVQARLPAAVGWEERVAAAKSREKCASLSQKQSLVMLRVHLHFLACSGHSSAVPALILVAGPSG